MAESLLDIRFVCIPSCPEILKAAAIASHVPGSVIESGCAGTVYEWDFGDSEIISDEEFYRRAGIYRGPK